MKKSTKKQTNKKQNMKKLFKYTKWAIKNKDIRLVTVF